MLTFARTRGQMTRGNISRNVRGGYRQPFNNRYQYFNSFRNNNNGNNHNNYNNFRFGNNYQRNNQNNGNTFRGRRGNTRQIFNVQSGQLQPDIQQLQQMLPGLAIAPGTQQPQQVVFQQPQLTPCEQPNFFGQVQRGQPSSSQ